MGTRKSPKGSGALLCGSITPPRDVTAALDAVPGLSKQDRQRARRELEALLPHDRAYALRRLGYLAAFWRADILRGGVNRCRTRAEVAAELTRANPRAPVTAKMLERVELCWRRAGARGLRWGRARGLVRSGPRTRRGRGPRELLEEAIGLLSRALEEFDAEARD